MTNLRDMEWRHVQTLLTLFWDDRELLWWSRGPYQREHLRFNVLCSDVFAWGCADAEDIELPADLDGLRAARAEFPDEEWPLLWVCRKRGMQPMPRYVRDLDHAHPFVAALLAAGPQRTPTPEAP